jgi:hypothetical protein
MASSVSTPSPITSTLFTAKLYDWTGLRLMSLKTCKSGSISFRLTKLHLSPSYPEIITFAATRLYRAGWTKVPSRTESLVASGADCILHGLFANYEPYCGRYWCRPQRWFPPSNRPFLQTIYCSRHLIRANVL